MNTVLDSAWFWIINNKPTTGFIIGLVIIVAILTWKAAVFYLSTKRWTEEMPNIQKLLSNIDTGFKTMNTLLLENDVIKQTCYTQINSPKSVSPLGESLITESGADKVLDIISPGFHKELEETMINGPLDLENICLRLLIENKDDKRFNNLKLFAYNNPKFHEKPLTYFNILSVMALKLRDLYIAKHPDIIKPS